MRRALLQSSCSLLLAVSAACSEPTSEDLAVDQGIESSQDDVTQPIPRPEESDAGVDDVAGHDLLTVESEGVSDAHYEYTKSVVEPELRTKAAAKAITQVFVVAGSSSSVACPDGMTKIAQDLNSGAGGAYVFLCYSTSTSYNYGYVTKLAVTSSSTNGIPTYPIWGVERMWGVRGRSTESREGELTPDLNAGASGKYIMLFQADGPVGSALTGLDVQISSNSNPAVPSGWNRLPTNLNDGAGGKYVYILYK